MRDGQAGQDFKRPRHNAATRHLENERETVGRYRERIRQAEAMGEFALSESLRAIIVQEQEHEIDLCDALGINVPPAIKPGDKEMIGTG